MTDLLRAALDAPGFAPLPPSARTLLEELGAPPRLGAHLRVVHDVAVSLTRWVRVPVDVDAVLFGAATHDIGKVLHPAELSGPGSAHEAAGYALLVSHGVPPELARFARTHGSWSAADVTGEDLLVSLADKVWKAKRVPDLEERVVEWLGGPGWETFMALDDELAQIAEGADSRLAFQGSYPTSG
ncbi:HD domain-containing protein [Amycolatopsis sp. OK19-0408]|uniref:HD domain-containing protein n=1 Tax=Amycolatopsis iheyensis TaxID=2945988 RepID=A0A9X2NLS8_9PSEU|nr:HD domain-containing protein [Amycolatopsis iheyensis]MCR6490318.1 HD domain-containing protein [Amycolatopsis iheyensis]